MADSISLGTIGLLLSAATLFVTIFGTVVVASHLSGRLHIDDGLRTVSLPSAAR